VDRVLIAPSILSADFTRLAEAIQVIEVGEADWVHVDVMDGHYVPNLTIGPPVVKALKAVTDLPLDVHLMIANTDDTLEWYLDAGADSLTVHWESTRHVHRAIQSIHAAGCKAGVSVNPATPVELLRDVLTELDLVLIMSVNPGFGGQAFIPRAAEKVADLAELCEAEGASPIIQVDGGINVDTAPLVSSMGARCLVAGNAVFGEADPAAAIARIRRAAEEAT
jgi:ribulose-phosphate 3-epimerase